MILIMTGSQGSSALVTSGELKTADRGERVWHLLSSPTSPLIPPSLLYLLLSVV